MVLEANAVANPGTMVVHPHNTPITLSTMMDSRRFYRLTVSARSQKLLLHSIKLFDLNHHAYVKLLSHESAHY